MSLPLPSTVMSSPGKSCLRCPRSALRSCRTFTSKVEIAPALSQTNSEIVPGFLPWMRSCEGAVDQRVGDVRHRQRHAGDIRANVQHGRPADHQVDLGAADRVADDGGRRRAGRVEDLWLLRLRRGNEDDDDVHDQRREEGGRPAALQGARSPELSRVCREHVQILRFEFAVSGPAGIHRHFTTSVARLSPRMISTVGTEAVVVEATVTAWPGFALVRPSSARAPDPSPFQAAPPAASRGSPAPIDRADCGGRAESCPRCSRARAVRPARASPTSSRP